MEEQRNKASTSKPSGLEKLKDSNSLPTCVRDLMTGKVISLHPNSTLQDAIGMMANNTFRHFPVVDESGHLAGVVSDRDLLRAMNHSRDWNTTNITEVMTQNVVTVRVETLLTEVVEHILTRRINCLPVVDEKSKVCGIVTSTDLLKAFLRLQKQIE